MNALSTLDATDACSYLDFVSMYRIANVSAEVALRVGQGFGVWESSALSTNALAIDGLLSPTGNWHNGATFDNWNWTPPDSNCSNFCAVGWPNMYHACGDGGGVHWIVGDGHDRYSSRTYADTSTWLR